MSDTYTKFRNEVLAGGATDEGIEPPPPSPQQAIASVAVILGLLVALGWYSSWALILVIGLIVSIFLHELGHFVTARLTGMKATQFFLFMGPRLFSFRRGETEYGLRLIPLGAFVRIIGMNNLDDVDPADEDRAYRSKSYPRRLLVITAGSMMHILIAIALLFGVYATKGERTLTDRVGLQTISAGFPAEAAGLQAGDIITSIDGIEPTTASGFTDVIRSHAPGDVISISVLRDGASLTKTVTLGTNPSAPTSGIGFLGVGSGNEVIWRNVSLATAATRSVTDLGRTMWDSVGGVVKVLNPVNIYQHLDGSNTDPASQPTTVVGITRFSKTIGQETGIGGVLLLLAGINVFVGLLNLFPLLPFDGGHAAIATYERLRTRRGRPPYRADVAKMIPVTMATLALVAFLLFAGVYLDVTKPLG